MSEPPPAYSASAPIAAIDIGTNTLRLIIARFRDSRLQRIASDRAVTRLGKGLTSTGLLDEEGVSKSIDALMRFKALCKEKGATRIVALGTSALREARDSAAFIKEARERTGISIEVISGEREAALTLKAMDAIDAGPGISGMPAAVLDIGGGSTEWILCSETCVAESLPVGAVKLKERFATSDPPSSGELGHIKSYISSSVSASLLKRSAHAGGALSFVCKRLFATGGTATTVAAIDLGLEAYDGTLVHLHTLDRPILESIFDRLAALPPRERGSIKGLEPGRADIIIYGVMILLAFMDALKAETVTVSDYGLLEGAIIEEYEKTVNR